ncbi:NrdH-redoxin, partial [Bacillus thuringiensis]|nr:NrdH-redoxin [Bacillus thuringiensis]
MIKVYSKTVCPQCRMVKKFFEDKGVPFEEINIEKNEDAKTYLQSLGF